LTFLDIDVYTNVAVFFACLFLLFALGSIFPEIGCFQTKTKGKRETRRAKAKGETRRAKAKAKGEGQKRKAKGEGQKRKAKGESERRRAKAKAKVKAKVKVGNESDRFSPYYNIYLYKMLTQPGALCVHASVIQAAMKERQDRKMMHLNRMVSMCSVKVTERSRAGNYYCFFKVPRFLVGFPKFDHDICTQYVMQTFLDMGYKVKPFANTLFISWQPSEPTAGSSATGQGYISEVGPKGKLSLNLQ
jgi:Family of unknown function (DUF5759)